MQNKMNSRQRVIIALQHQEPDRVPIDFGGSRASGIMAKAYRNLKKYLSMPVEGIRIYDVMQGLALPELEVLERMGNDVIQLNRLKPVFGISIKEWEEGKWGDGPGYLVPKDFNPITIEDESMEIMDGCKVLARRIKSSPYFEPVYHPLSMAATTDDVDNYDFSMLPSVEEIEYLRAEGKRLYEETDYAILCHSGVKIFEQCQMAFGFVNFMTNLYSRRELVEYFLDKLVESYIHSLKPFLEAVKDYVQIIQVTDDLGTQNSLQISPQMYREIIKPRQARVWQFIKENSNAYLFLHSCGAIYEIIQDLIEIGVDILNPVQISASGMNPIRLKREFGKHITFWGGGCDTQKTLPFGTPEDIIREVKEMLEIFKPGGGFVFTQVHNIQADIQPVNIVTMYDAVKAFGKY